MSDQIKAKRPYNSSRRQAQARETHRLIVEVARQLFIKRGYAGTTIEAIAREAGVAVETVYATFRSKHAILAQLVDISVGGDDEPIPLLERPGPQAVKNERDQPRQIILFSRDMRRIMERVGPIFPIIETAAETEPEIATLLRRMLERRLTNLTQFVEWLAGNGPLRPGLSVADGADIVWTITSAEVFRLLTVHRGWSGDRYEEWLGETLITLLLPAQTATSVSQSTGPSSRNAHK